MAKYSVIGSQAVADAVDSILSVVGAAANARRHALLEFTWGPGVDATAADVIVEMTLSNASADGAGDAVTPTPLNVDDPAATCVALENHGTEPTYGTDLMKIGRHMRATYRWVALPGGELIFAAADDEGWGILLAHGSATHLETITAIFDEL